MHSRLLLLFLCGFISATRSAPAVRAQHIDKTVMVHYMPWYASKPVSGYWGWHWTMNRFDPDTVGPNGRREAASHDHPLIDLYDSGDADALECHVLLMKLAGIDGVIIDWYGIAEFRDYAEIHRNSQHLVKHIRKAGLKFAVCYEDQTVKHMIDGGVLPSKDDVLHGRADLKWLAENWFADDSYIRIDGRPVLLVFGPQHFEKEQWSQLLSDHDHRPLVYALPHLVEKSGLDGAFGWPPVTGGREISPAEWRRYLTSLYSARSSGQSVVSIAFPAFRDIYEQAELHESYGSIDARDGRTLAETFALARESSSRIIQIATWNDYGEGTVIEPTQERGYRCLEHLQQETGSRQTYHPDDLRLPVMLYRLRKLHAGDPAKEQQLQSASDLLYSGNCAAARSVLESLPDPE